MGKAKESLKEYTESYPKDLRRPAETVEGRENQLIALAVDKVEERMRNGTATASEYIHFLKLATTREAKEKRKLDLECLVLESKQRSIDSSITMEKIYTDAMNAFKKYSGHDDDEEDVF